MIQLNTLEDRNITDKNHWDLALKFLESSLLQKLEQNEATLKEQVRAQRGDLFVIRFRVLSAWYIFDEDAKPSTRIKKDYDMALEPV